MPPKKNRRRNPTGGGEGPTSATKNKNDILAERHNNWLAHRNWPEKIRKINLIFRYTYFRRLYLLCNYVCMYVEPWLLARSILTPAKFIGVVKLLVNGTL